MWVMTSFGILMPGLRPAHTLPEGDNRVLQVRARREKDLQILKDEYMGDDLGDPISLPHTDYEWRAYCTLEAWGRALAKIAMDIDYVKFKETAESKYNDHDLHSVYLSVWSTIFSKMSTQRHQDEYWGETVGKYGTTYPGRGNFSFAKDSGYAPKKGKGKKGKGKDWGVDYSASTGQGRQAWWADAEGLDHSGTGVETYWEEDAYFNFPKDLEDPEAERHFREEIESLKRGSGRFTEAGITWGDLHEALEDLDPALKPVFDANNNIDHSYCDHGNSKSAKKRCRQRWRRYAAERDLRVFGTARV